MFTVTVYNPNGDPKEGARVRLSFTGITHGISDIEYTDSNGEAVFDCNDGGSMTVFVDGNDCGEEYYEDGGSIDITI